MSLNPGLEKTIVRNTRTKTSRAEQSTQRFDILSFHGLNIFPESKSLLFTFFSHSCINKINVEVYNALGFKKTGVHLSSMQGCHYFYFGLKQPCVK